ncbi:RagB/SusD family nutrient uptake outer membrane protein [Sphingobacterium siyangense]|uniref:RagB/SusD family nutrient uptake outer membrane protein n=1 Tax=Sphingobacterium siyangense TaxID=459529 RepID=UPI003DA591DF
MMKKILLKFLILLTLLGILSCGDFLEVKPKGVVLPEKLTDFESMLNSFTMTQSFPSALLYCTDDYYGTYSAKDKSVNANLYFWREEKDINDQVSPVIWGQLYRIIYDANVIINNVMSATGSNDQKKKEVLGEALLARADAYFTLLTVYAKSYNINTKNTDLGLPWVTTTNVTDKVPQRALIQDNIDSIVNNTLRAIDCLPLNNVNRYRATKGAAKGFLSRVYLYIADYTNAEKYALETMAVAHKLTDYNTIKSSDDLPIADLDPEILWQRGSEDRNVPVFMLYSDELKTYFDENDLRYSILTISNNKGINRGGAYGEANFGITFPEVYLTLAELAARSNRTAAAMEYLNIIRKVRIKASAYQPATSLNKDDALKLVLAERRRELAFGATRWMDMKRLDRDGLMKDVKRINRENSELQETLTPQSNRYTFQIPTRVRKFNPNMQVN